MIIFPAIDIKDGKVVRLRQGMFDAVTEYADNPVHMAQHWVSQGAQWLHVVDLDGAKSGTMQNIDVITTMAQTVPVPLQVGGGIRREADIDRLFKGGVRRIVLGTRVIENRSFLKQLVQQWPEHVAVSLDCAQGRVAQQGWTVVTDIKAMDFAKELEQLGLRYLIYTDIKRDGMLSGPDFAGLKELLNTVKISLIASGGISNIDDVLKLRELVPDGLVGVITGKAIYEGTLDLAGAIKVCSPNA